MIMPNLDGVVAVSQATLQTGQELCKLSLPFTVSPRRVEPDEVKPAVVPDLIRRELGTPTKAPVLLSIGSLTPEKRIDRLIETFEMVHGHAPDVYLWIIGDGPLRRQLEQQTQSRGIASNVRF